MRFRLTGLTGPTLKVFEKFEKYLFYFIKNIIVEYVLNIRISRCCLDFRKIYNNKKSY